MLSNEFLLQDRVQKIQQVVGEYGEENFNISYSGGKDSTVLSALVDLALPGNQIPRVYADTGIEFMMMRDFVKKNAEKDSRIVILKPTVPIKPMLEKEGYPFKSKVFSKMVDRFQRVGMTDGVRRYLGDDPDVKWSSHNTCPWKLRYFFDERYAPDLKISARCCDRLKKDPIHKWQDETGRKISIIGLRREESGGRYNAKCLSFADGKLKAFQPLVAVMSDWMEWFIEEYNVEICDIYKPPYNFQRTGCVGCPFNTRLNEELDVLEELLPNERKRAEAIWKPVYEEYRRRGYRLNVFGKEKKK